MRSSSTLTAQIFATASPRNDLTITLGSDGIWRHKQQDAIYGTSGNVLLPATGSANYVGTTAEAASQLYAIAGIAAGGASILAKRMIQVKMGFMCADR